MKVARVLRRNPESGDVEVVARVVADGAGAPAVIESDEPALREMVELLIDGGISGPGGVILMPVDGEAFVDALPENLRGSRLWAEAM